MQTPMSKQSGRVVAESGQLTRRDLTTFDGEATDLVLEMIAAGWTGRISQRGHAIMRAPDGEATHSVARDSLRGRSGRNARSTFERWQRRQAMANHPSSESSSGNVIQLFDLRSCGECERTFDTRQALSAHKKSHNPWVTCPLCGQPAKVLGQHFRFHHQSIAMADVLKQLDPKPVEAPVEPQNEPEAPPPVVEPVETVVEPVTVLTTPMSAMDALLQVLTELESLREENARLRAALEVRS